jgi:hypothetical protein
MTKKIKLAIGFIFLLGLLFYVMLWQIPNMSYASEEILEGDYYGISIGMNRAEAYYNLPKVLSELDSDNVQFSLVVVPGADALVLNLREGDQLLVQTRFSDSEYERFKGQEYWTVYLKGDYSQFLKVYFCDDKVCKIYFHTQKFEVF